MANDGMDFESLEQADRKIIVGIDFVTTFSGVAWAETMRPDRREAVCLWPVSDAVLEGESSSKVPTKVRYVGKDKIQWGFAIPPDAPAHEIIRWFKLWATYSSYEFDATD